MWDTGCLPKRGQSVGAPVAGCWLSLGRSAGRAGRKALRPTEEPSQEDTGADKRVGFAWGRKFPTALEAGLLTHCLRHGSPDCCLKHGTALQTCLNLGRSSHYLKYGAQTHLDETVPRRCLMSCACAGWRQNGARCQVGARHEVNQTRLFWSGLGCLRPSLARDRFDSSIETQARVDDQ